MKVNSILMASIVVLLGILIYLLMNPVAVVSKEIVPVVYNPDTVYLRGVPWFGGWTGGWTGGFPTRPHGGHGRPHPPPPPPPPAPPAPPAPSPPPPAASPPPPAPFIDMSKKDLKESFLSPARYPFA